MNCRDLRLLVGMESLFVGVGGADVGREEEGLCLSQVRKNKIRRKGCGCII